MSEVNQAGDPLLSEFDELEKLAQSDDLKADLKQAKLESQ